MGSQIERRSRLELTGESAFSFLRNGRENPWDGNGEVFGDNREERGKTVGLRVSHCSQTSVHLDYAFESSNLHIQMFYRLDVAPDSRGRNYTRVWRLLKNGRKRVCRHSNEIIFYFCFDVTKKPCFSFTGQCRRRAIKSKTCALRRFFKNEIQPPGDVSICFQNES